MLIIHMLREHRGEPDVRGDRITYPKGWTGEVDDDAAGYCIARGIARPVDPLPVGVDLGIAVLREVIVELEAQRIEPTFKAVYAAIARVAAAQEEEARKASSLAPSDADQHPARGNAPPVDDVTDKTTVVVSIDGRAGATAAAAAAATPRTIRRTTPRTA